MRRLGGVPQPVMRRLTSIERRQRRRREVVQTYHDRQPFVATIQAFTAMAKVWLLLLCYSALLFGLFGLMNDFEQHFPTPVHCPSNDTAPVCCQDSDTCFQRGDQQSLSLLCGFDAAGTPFVYSTRAEASSNATLLACCETRLEDDNIFQAFPAIHECCVDQSWPSDIAPCEVSDRCRLAIKDSVGCCAAAKSSNGTGWTALTTSVWWRPGILTFVNGIATGVMVTRAGISYCRETLDLPVIMPSQLFSTFFLCNPPSRTW